MSAGLQRCNLRPDSNVPQLLLYIDGYRLISLGDDHREEELFALALSHSIAVLVAPTRLLQQTPRQRRIVRQGIAYLPLPILRFGERNIHHREIFPHVEDSW